MTVCNHRFNPRTRCCSKCGLDEREYIASIGPLDPLIRERQSHVLIADPLIKRYTSYNTQTSLVTMEMRHVVPGITLDALPRDRLGGILFSRLTILAGVMIEPEALNWVLSMLRDIKDEPSGIGN